MGTEVRCLAPGQIQQEYHQTGADPLHVSFFTDDDFETLLQRPAHVGRGEQRAARIRSGVFSIQSRLIAGEADTQSTARHPGFVYLFFNLSAQPLRSSVNGIRRDLFPDDCYIGAPQNVGSLHYTPHCVLRILSLFVSPADFVSALEDVTAGVPSNLIAALTGLGAGRPFAMSRMSPEMRRIIEQIDACPFRGSLKRLYLEGKILELLALRLGQLSVSPITKQVPARSLRLKGRLEEARSILERRMKRPPSLHDLSKEVAMSPSLLKASFREVFGETVFACLRNLRLDRAREMLLEEGASVKEVSWAVGYASLSHFARAFRQRFGASPRAWARPQIFR